MADFPNSPTIGDIANGRIWNGTKWDVVSRKYYEKISVLNNVNNTVDIDLSTGNLFELALSDQTTVSFSNPPASGKEQKFYLKLGIDTGYEDVNSYDIENASYDNVSFSGFSGVPDHTVADFKLSSIKFKPDGTRFFVTGTTTASTSTYYVHQFDLSTAWDITSATLDYSYLYDGFSSISLFFSSDGLKMYTNSSFGYVVQHTLTSAWDIRTASSDGVQTTSGTFDINGNFNSRGMQLSNDGTSIFVSNSVTDTIKQFTLNTPYDLTSANSLAAYDLDVSTEMTFPVGFKIVKNGTEIFICGFDGNKIYKYVLSTPWDLSTAVYSEEFLDVSAQATSYSSFPFDIDFKTDGLKLYVVGYDQTSLEDIIYQYTSNTTDTIPNITWPASIQWESGSAPTLPALGETDLLEFSTSDGGTTYYAKIIADNIG